MQHLYDEDLEQHEGAGGHPRDTQGLQSMTIRFDGHIAIVIAAGNGLGPAENQDHAIDVANPR